MMLNKLIEELSNEYRNVVSCKDMQIVGQDLRKILDRRGLGIAIMVAYRHGLKIGHIPVKLPTELIDAKESDSNFQKTKKNDNDNDKYIFVHIPIRKIRNILNLISILTILKGLKVESEE